MFHFKVSCKSGAHSGAELHPLADVGSKRTFGPTHNVAFFGSTPMACVFSSNVIMLSPTTALSLKSFGFSKGRSFASR